MISTPTLSRGLHLAVILSGLWLLYQVATVRAAPANLTFCCQVCKNVYEYKDCDFNVCYSWLFWDCRFCARWNSYCDSIEDAVCDDNWQHTHRTVGTSCTEVCPCYVPGTMPTYVETRDTVVATMYMHYGERTLCARAWGGSN